MAIRQLWLSSKAYKTKPIAKPSSLPGPIPTHNESREVSKGFGRFLKNFLKIFTTLQCPILPNNGADFI